MTAPDVLLFNVFITSQDLRKLLHSKDYTDLPNSNNSIRNQIINYSKKIRNQVSLEIKECLKSGERFSLTFDEWTTSSNKRFMNLNVHGGEQFLKLGLVRVQGSMTADQCIKTLNTRLAQHGLTLENYIVVIITDGPNVIYGKGRKTC